MNTQNKRLYGIALTVGLLLFMLAIMDLLSDEMLWSLFDYLVAGALLLGTGLLCELVLRKVKEFKYRIMICVFILATFFIIWAELAVGIFGTPLAGN